MLLSSQSLLPTKIPSSAANPRTLILHRCKSRRELNQIHAQLIKTRPHLNPSLAENLLESAAVLLPGSMDYALSIFRKMDEPDASAYNVMIRGFTLKQSPDQALTLFAEMLEGSVEPDDFTFPCALKACARLTASGEGKQVHALVVKLGCWSLGFVGNSLVHMYASCGETGIARRVFDGMPEKDVVAWNALFAGYCKMGRWEEVVKLFREMQGVAASFDEVTLVSVLTACGRLADVELGEWVSQCMDRNGWKKDLALVTALIDMYAKCGKVDTARRLFDQMSRRDVVAWSAMISGYSQGRRCKEALDLFHEMLMVDVEPNEITLVSVLSSCAVLGALETGKWVHLYVKKRMMKMTVTLGTALMDCYLKCGSIDEAIEVFGMMPQKNVFSWTVLIQGLANNGQGEKAIEFFRVMNERNIKPNDVTFIGVLSACSHAGLVDEGREFFVSMGRDFSIEPQIEHFGCMVDILGRAGLIQEAYQFITNMPVLPNAVVWRTLLASCRAHKNIEMGEESLKRIAQLGPLHSGDHILMSNIYASVGRWEDAVRVRTEMKENGIKKMPGCTLIELNGGEIYEFLSEDNKHARSEEVYEASETMMQRIKLAGYIPNSIDARLDAEDDDKESALAHHSEKLAIAFGLIKTPHAATIRIFKNLRVCTDCHNATKIISKVYNREIVVRDWNRFHHFKNGSCSCNDYW